MTTRPLPLPLPLALALATTLAMPGRNATSGGSRSRRRASTGGPQASRDLRRAGYGTLAVVFLSLALLLLSM